jgi:hypothetical protein
MSMFLLLGSSTMVLPRAALIVVQTCLCADVAIFDRDTMLGAGQMASGKHRRRRSALTPRVPIGQVKYHLQYAITSVLFCNHCGGFRLRRYSVPL